MRARSVLLPPGTNASYLFGTIALFGVLGCGPANGASDDAWMGDEDGDIFGDARDHGLDEGDSGPGDDGDAADVDAEAEYRGPIDCDAGPFVFWRDNTPIENGCELVLDDERCRLLGMPDRFGVGGSYAAGLAANVSTAASVWVVDLRCGSGAMVQDGDDPIAFGGYLDVEYPWLAWGCLGPAPAGSGAYYEYRVRLYHLETGERRDDYHHVLSDIGGTGPGRIQGVDLDYPWIAVRDCRWGEGICSLVIANVVTGEERVVYPFDDQEGGSMDDGRVAYDGITPGVGWDTWLYDVRSDERRPLTEDAAEQWGAVIAEGWVAWVDLRHSPTGTPIAPGDSDIYGWDLATDREVPLVVAPAAQTSPLGIQDGWLFWTDYRNDPAYPGGGWDALNADVYGMNLATGEVRQITSFPDTSEYYVGKDGDWVYVLRRDENYIGACIALDPRLVRCPLR